MLEIGIFCVIVLAAGYWATMFVMGRRDDVIHGKFVHVDEEGDFIRPALPALPPPFPKRPVKAAQPARVQPAKDPTAKTVNSEALQSLLAAIQQDLVA
ncbi:hypothetical protein IVB14_15240 [Bradyrhizobium sp. 180]|uniref:hypothetical protein n=1 Tax=unclassified Bradyrhizobium TaxID=2631580 RepID=UPI001FF9990C|nr:MULTISPECIES: hypothetical protein [unclassified Bradyrhizobium]MCK1420527.1 hypothetical protein [Bradyrhizobium sp. CW12]MCK1491739.1 hypothetical protein [Bradyrhizobium sp. 180]MCK1531233.1 hypothetical protein [Bradyrhizobium sp. 182]MCK1648005.1 hypothetical protein [Bradyrhizobium sp. 154]MCK1669655.1 hypothetical protein [Bradyrhizobium sp. 153]